MANVIFSFLFLVSALQTCAADIFATLNQLWNFTPNQPIGDLKKRNKLRPDFQFDICPQANGLFQAHWVNLF